MATSSTLPPVLAIAGPTASGKSALALRLAEAVKGEIVNADALQVYHSLDILTARPGADDLAHVPHHLYAHIDPAIRYSTGDWVRDAVATIDDIRDRGRRAILVGGTGLYFRSLFNGIADIPKPSSEAVAKAEALLADGIATLRARAEVLDPTATARLQGDDPQRLLRIVSVALGTDKPLSVWQTDTVPLVTHSAGVVVMPNREMLYARIESRFDNMMNGGAVAEARAFAELDLDPALPASKAIGVAELLSHLRGGTDLDTAVELAKRNSRRLAKRQTTWFRNQHPDWPHVAPDIALDDLLAALESEPRD